MKKSIIKNHITQFRALIAYYSCDDAIGENYLIVAEIIVSDWPISKGQVGLSSVLVPRRPPLFPLCEISILTLFNIYICFAIAIHSPFNSISPSHVCFHDYSPHLRTFKSNWSPNVPLAQAAAPSCL